MKNRSKTDNEDWMIEKLISISKQDLSSSKILYENKKYPQSMFFLQQSFEKALKSYGLFIKIIQLEDLTRYSHKTREIYRKIFKKTVKKMKNDKELLEKAYKNPKTKKILGILPKKFKEYLEEYKKLQNYAILNESNVDKEIDTINKYPRKFLFVSEKNLRENLDKLDNIKKELDGAKKLRIKSEEIRKNINRLFENLNNLDSKIISEKDKTFQLIEKGDLDINQIMMFILRSSVLGSIGFILAKLLDLHSIYTRYPIEEENLDPSFYREDYIFIKYYLKIFKYVKFFVESVEIMLKEHYEK